MHGRVQRIKVPLPAVPPTYEKKNVRQRSRQEKRLYGRALTRL
jgi:hypothetical protein